MKMRWGVLFLVLFQMCSIAWSGTEKSYRNFKDQKGRVIRGCVLAYDMRTKKVRFERDNHRIVKVPITAFSEADQDYIQNEWLVADFFKKEKYLKISVSRDYESFSKERCFVYWVKTTPYFYKIQIENRAPVALKNISLEYCIYYKQDCSLEIIRLEDSSGTIKRISNETDMEGVLNGKISIDEIKAKGKWEGETEKVKIFTMELDASYLSSNQNEKKRTGEIVGIWIFLRQKLPSGKVLIREYTRPDNLSKNKVWYQISDPVGANRAGWGQK